ncbi:MAG: hypothetical protein KC502_09725 [Myxococcales bacterium]|nr:hypothetical protein [Myxococcales bacterium]
MMGRAAVFEERFDGWMASDFDAYLERKWRSNRFNLERGRVRSRLTDALKRAARQAGVDTDGWTLWSSLDHPSFFNGHVVRGQRVAWCRIDAERERLMRADPTVEAERVDRCHSHLGVHVDGTGLELMLAVPPQAAFDLTLLTSASEVLTAACTQLEVDWAETDDGGWRLSKKWNREDAPADEDAAVGEMTAWLAAAWACLAALTWSEDNDPAGWAERLTATAADAAENSSTAESDASDSTQDSSPTRAPAATQARADQAPVRANRYAASKPRLAPAGSGAKARQEEAQRVSAEREARRQRAMEILAASSPTPRGDAPQASAPHIQGDSGRSSGGRSSAGRPSAGRPSDNRGNGSQRSRGNGPNRSQNGGRGDAARQRGGHRSRGGDAQRGGQAHRGGQAPRGERDGRSRDRAPRQHDDRRPFQSRPERGPRVSVDVGAQVELKHGLFAGKLGTVKSVKKGQAEVEVGAMTLNVPLADLAPI